MSSEACALSSLTLASCQTAVKRDLVLGVIVRHVRVRMWVSDGVDSVEGCLAEGRPTIKDTVGAF